MAFSLSNITSLFKYGTASPSAQGVIGLDVGASSIKVVQLHQAHGVATLDTYGELQLGPYAGADIGRTTRLPVNKLIEALVDILRESAATAHSIAVEISYGSSFVTVLEVGTTDSEKIAAMMPVEARKYVPVPLADVELDWFPIAEQDAGKSLRLLLVAIHREALAKYEAMVKGADLESVCTEIEMFSTVRSSVTEGDETVALIDFGASATKMYIVHKGIINKTHTVLMSGVELTESLAKILGVDFKVAEELKRSVGLEGMQSEPRIHDTLVAHLDRCLRELHKVMHTYEQDSGHGIQKVILSGGGCLLAGLGVHTHDVISYPIEFADPFSKVAHPVFLEDTLREAGPSFAGAIGAALRGLTL